MQVMAHHGPGINFARKNTAEFQNSLFDPELAVLEASLGVRINATQPRAPHAAIDAVESACVIWLYELAAGLGRPINLACSDWLCKPQMAGKHVG